MSRFCANCGTPMADDAVFCKSCGAKTEAGGQVNGDTAQIPPQPAYTPPRQAYTPPQQAYAIAPKKKSNLGLILGTVGGCGRRGHHFAGAVFDGRAGRRQSCNQRQSRFQRYRRQVVIAAMS